MASLFLSAAWASGCGGAVEGATSDTDASANDASVTPEGSATADAATAADGRASTDASADARANPSCKGEGASCLDSTGCRAGAIACVDGGAPSCVAASSTPAGQGCGTNMVCDGNGACVACTAGAACRSASDCHVAATSCATGASTCVDTGNAADGTYCGGNDAGNAMVCQAGACVPCVAGGACTPAAPCHQGQTISCNTHPDACKDLGTPAMDGTTCGANMVCSGGGCVACTANLSCAPANDCSMGLTDCSSGASVCVDQKMNLADGTPCGAAGAGTTCANGACVCPTGTHLCNGLCAPNTDVATCGNSCTPCPTPGGSTASCSAGGTCSFTCAGAGAACNIRADTCNGAACACSAGVICAAGQRCVNGACTCDKGSCNPGCCAGTTCRGPVGTGFVPEDTDHCGDRFGGISCVACPPFGDDCGPMGSGGLCSCGGGAACQPGQSCLTGHACTCPACHAPSANVCAADGSCRCGGGPPCPAGKTCIAPNPSTLMIASCQ